MGKKKRGHPDVEELLARPWCYYCERDFDDLKILISHQKAKHFKCERCGRRLNTAGGLSVHLNQVHKETLTAVDNALPNRSNLDVEIFGMEGIPEDVVTAHNQRVLSNMQSAEAERRVATGNPPSGSGSGAGGKKPKFESPAEMKKRLAEHKAKIAEGSAGGNSGRATPVGAGQGASSPAVAQNTSTFSGSPTYVQPQHGLPAPPNNPNYPAFPQPVNQQQSNYPPGQPVFPQPPQQNFAPANYQQYPPPNLPQQHMPQQFHSQGGSGSPPFPNAPHAYGAGSPPLPYQQNYQQNFQDQYRTQTPPQNMPLPQRPGSQPPSASGLPQRPSFAASPANAYQMPHYQQGQPPVQQDSSHFRPPSQQQQPGAWGPVSNGSYPGHSQPPPAAQGQAATPTPQGPQGGPLSVDDVGAVGKAEAKGAGEIGDRKSKKEKDKPTKLVFSDNEVSPEEKMAKLPRYAFDPESKEETVLGDATVPAVAGAQVGADDVLDPSG